MDALSIFLMAVITVPLCIGYLFMGSKDALESYHNDVRDGKTPEENDMSIAFSFGSGYGITMLGIMVPLTYIFQCMGINHFPNWFIISGTLSIFLTCVTLCEWFLRKLARKKEPEIQFRKWLFLT